MTRRVLISGAGSIGRRHAHNLLQLEPVTLAVVDPHHERAAKLAAEVGGSAHSDFRQALTQVEPAAVLVCSPPILHVDQALAAVLHGAHVFVEKPVSHSLDGLDRLLSESERLQRVVQVGYNLRFHPALQQIKGLVEADTIGRILWARAEFGQYLPDWRPQQDYRVNYTARKELGGGILLDASHEVDYMTWLLGWPVTVSCVAETSSDLAVDVEDSASLSLRFANRTLADIHVDFVQRHYARTCKLAGDAGTLEWDYAARTVRLYRAATRQWEVHEHAVEPNAMYVAELKHFLDCIDGRQPPFADLRQAARVLQLTLAAKTAASKGCAQELKWHY